MSVRLFAFLAALYLLTANGRIVHRDGEAMFQVAVSLVERADLAVPLASVFTTSSGPTGTAGDALSYATETASPGPDGRVYSMYGLGQSLATVPLYLLGRLLLLALPGVSPFVVTRFAAALLNPLVTAATVPLAYAVSRRLGVGARAALTGSLAYGLGTLAWPYAKSYCSEPLTALLLLVGFYGLHRGSRSGGIRCQWLALGGAALGLAALTRPIALVAAPPLGAYLLLNLWLDRPGLRRGMAGILAFGGPLLLTLGVALWYNWARFASPFTTGYQSVGWTTPLPVGLYGLLLSPGKGILWYAPPLLLSLAGSVAFLRRSPREAAAIAALVLLWLAVHSTYRYWEGGWSWGPRFLVPILPFLCLPASFYLDSPQRAEAGTAERFGLALRRFLLPAALAVGIAVQLPAVAADYTRYLWGTYTTLGDGTYERVIYDPLGSPVLGQWRALAEVVGNAARPGGLQEIRRQALEKVAQVEASDLPEAERSVEVLDLTVLAGINVPDLWFVHLYIFGAPVPVVAVAPLLLLLGVFGGLFLMDRGLRGEA